MTPQPKNVIASGTRRKSLRRALLFCSLLAAGVVSAPALAHQDRDRDTGPVVNTNEGAVRGFVKDGVNIFMGIPYAAPPVGKLRWQPPQPVARWGGRPLDATAFGNICAQTTTLGVFAGPASIDEDCLYLNVFTTRLGAGHDGRGGGHDKRGGKNPVLVWIHGGGNVDGYPTTTTGASSPLGGQAEAPRLSSRSTIAWDCSAI